MSIPYFHAVKKFVGERRNAQIQKQQAGLSELLRVLKTELASMQARKEEMEVQLSAEKKNLVHLRTFQATNGLPDAFMCPITREVMREPVMLIESGHTYERAAIEAWLLAGRRADPLTNQALHTAPQLAPNFAMRKAIQEFAYHCQMLLGEGLASEAVPTKSLEELLEEAPSLAPVEASVPPVMQTGVGNSLCHSGSYSSSYRSSVARFEAARMPRSRPVTDLDQWLAGIDGESEYSSEMISIVL